MDLLAAGACSGGFFPRWGMEWFNGLQLCKFAGDAVYQVLASLYVYKYHGSSASLLANVWDIASGRKSPHHHIGDQPAWIDLDFRCCLC